MLVSIRLVALFVSLLVLTAPQNASAQFNAQFSTVTLTAPTAVPFRFGTDDTNDLIPNQDSGLRHQGFRGYSPTLDVRRRIFANPSVRSITLSGPMNTGLVMSRDDCAERGRAIAGLPCTPVPAGQVDRLEVAWFQARPADAVRFNELNGQATPLKLPASGTNSMLNPGAQLRFVSGPPVQYVSPWGSSPPTGEGPGFLVDEMLLAPAAGSGNNTPPLLDPYDRATAVLLGDPRSSEDSLYFRLTPSEHRATMAIWFPASDPDADIKVHARCGGLPSREERVGDSQGTSTPVFVDLDRPCAAGWHVVVAQTSTQPTVFHFAVGEHFPGRELADIRVGIEFPTSGANEDLIIRETVREAAWRFFGSTGGSYLLRSFTFQALCNNVHICWRNNPRMAGCAAGHGIANPIQGNLHLCAFPTKMSVTANAATLAHEMLHAFAHLGDEYWRSNDFYRICGQSGRQIRRCSHSIMGYHHDGRVAVCTDTSHNAAPEFFFTTPTGFSRAFNVLGPHTIHECSNGEVDRKDPYGASGWAQLYGNGVATRPFPQRSPSNFDYRVFARSAARQEIGAILD